jgi:hypothetical protein
MNAPAMIGHNSSPYIEARDTVNDAVSEAREWLDGKPVADKDQADGLAHLLDLLRKAHKGADEARKLEAKPFDDGKAEVQQRYKPLLTDAERAIDVVKAAIAKWQREEQRRADEAARIAREAAERAQREAEEARRAADLANLAEREAAERKLAEAERLAKAADKAEAAPVGAKGAYAARRTALVATRVPVAIADGKAALRWAMERQPDELKAALLEIVRRAKASDVPGVTYEERETVR